MSLATSSHMPPTGPTDGTAMPVAPRLDLCILLSVDPGLFRSSLGLLACSLGLHFSSLKRTHPSVDPSPHRDLSGMRWCC